MNNSPEYDFDSLSDEDFAREYNKMVSNPNAVNADDASYEEAVEEHVDAEGEEDVVPEAPAEGTESDEAEGTDEEEQPEGETEGSEEVQEATNELSADDWKLISEPFKANGVELKVNTPEEARKLMQMGANYTKKMQQLSPNLKMMETLRQAGLLEQSKINHLIDIYNKNPQAIAKLMEDSEIDPLSLDSEEAAKYSPTEHAISDEEFRFQQVLDDVVQDPDGLELLKAAQNWDVETKLGLQKSPDQLHVLVEQKKSGVYELITQELERQKLFSPQLANMPFLDAYQAVGTYLLQQRQYTQTAQTPPVPQAPIDVQARIPQLPKAGGNVKAASQVRNSQPKQTVTPDWENMSDEEFAKYYNKFVHNKKGE